MICYRPFELHNHTLHSDGQFTVPELCRAARDYGYAGIALTDHNTAAGCGELTAELCRETLPAICGMEWTTFFGHLLVLGCERNVDWRFVVPDTIDDALAQIHAEHGVAGIAHPMEFGAPLMCGCHWDFNVTRWDLIDYIEVWSKPDPLSMFFNPSALAWWESLLSQGEHIAISAGRDWHQPDTKMPYLLSATYLGLEGEAVTQAGVLDAIRSGRTFVTLGPTIEVYLIAQGRPFGLGETAPAGDAELRITIAQDSRHEQWERFHIKISSVRVTMNGKIIYNEPYSGNAITMRHQLEPGWVHVSLYGDHERRQNEMLALTSPIYLN